MVTNPNWPYVGTFCAFTGDPNDATATPVWTDVSARNTAWSYSYGRQYELDQNQAGEATVNFRNFDEALNPTNTGSPYYPNVLPYRRLNIIAMWPPTSPTGNLWNTSAGQGLKLTGGVDPTLESYTIGSTPLQPDVLNYTATPTITTTNPFQGSQCLTCAVTTTPGPLLGFQALTIPGRTYTGSIYTRQSVANTVQAFVNAGYQNFSAVGATTGTSTSTANAYVRLTCTFTATSFYHSLWVQTTGSPSAATLWVDAIQLEEGGSATTFTSTGNVIYPVFTGNVERWPSKWDYSGLYGVAETTCVDALGLLAQQTINSELVNITLGLTPAYYWPLWEPANATAFADISGNAGPPLLATATKYGAGAGITSGSSGMSYKGDPGSVAVTFTSTGSNGAEAFTGLANSSTAPVAVPAVIGSSWAVSVSVWFRLTDYRETTQDLVSLSYIGPGNASWPAAAQVGTVGTQGTASPFVYYKMVTSTGTVNQIFAPNVGSNPISVNDGETWNHMVAVTQQTNGGNTSVSCYLNGQLQQTTTVTTASLGGMFPAPANTIEVGGFTRSGSSGSFGGDIAHVGVWNRALSLSEISSIFNAALTGKVLEGSGARITRYIQTGPTGYTGPLNIDTGTTVMGSGTVTRGTSVLTACQDVATTENGNLWANPGGFVRFTSRTSRYLNTTAKWVFGENTAGGELPYEGDIAYDYDPTQIYNTVVVSQNNGVVATAIDTTSAKRYFSRTLERTINPYSASEAIDASNYLLARYKQPSQRIAGLTLNPAANPSLWPAVLSMQIGDRVTVKRRTLPGYTMSADFFIEQIGHTSSPGEWTVTLQMSPAPAGFQPWILGDATYSVLGTTTIPGY